MVAVNRPRPELLVVRAEPEPVHVEDAAIRLAQLFQALCLLSSDAICLPSRNIQTHKLTGVYLEKMLKQCAESIWMQNIRLALLGIPITFIAMWVSDYEAIKQGTYHFYQLDNFYSCFFHST